MPGAVDLVHRTLLALAAIALLPSAAAMELQALWTQEDLESDVPLRAFDTYGFALEDVGLGRPVFLGMNDNARTYVVDLLEGEVLAELETRHPGDRTDWWTPTLNGVAVGDLDADGRADLMVLNTGGHLSRWELEATSDGLTAERHWERFAYAPDLSLTFWADHPWLEPEDPAERTHHAHGHPFIARPAPDEAPLVYVHSDDLPGAFAFDVQGGLRWMDDWHDGHAGPWVGPLEGEGPPLALFATDAGHVVARNADGGEEVWVHEVPDDVRPGSIQVPPAVHDLDGDGASEAFVAARVAVEGAEPDWMEHQRASMDLLDAHGEVLWSVRHPQGNPMIHSEAEAVDVNEDGVRDLVVLDWNTIGRYPGSWERLGPGNLFALDGRDGALLWSTPVDAPETDFRFPVVQMEGVVVPHAQDGHPGLAVVGLQDGAQRSWTQLPAGWVSSRGAGAADLDGDGLLEMVVRLERPAEGCPEEHLPCREGAIAVFTTDLPTGGLQAAGASDRNADAWEVAKPPEDERTDWAPIDLPPQQASPFLLPMLLLMGSMAFFTIQWRKREARRS